MTSRTIRRLSTAKSVSAKFFLDTCTLADVVKSKEKDNRIRKLVSVEGSTSVFAAMQIMLQKEVNTIVLYRTKGDSKKKIYFGMVNTVDLVYWFAWKQLKTDSEQIPISELAGVTEETKNFWTYPVAQHLDSVVQPFMQGIHAIIARRLHSKIRTIFVSQWDVVKFIHSTITIVTRQNDFFETTLKNSGILGRTQKPMSIESSSPVTKGFEMMSKMSFTGIAVVDEDGKLVSSLKSSHARQLFNKDLEKKFAEESVAAFLKRIGEPFGEKTLQNVVDENFTIEEMFKLVVDQHEHRVWILDESSRPRHIITLSDMIKETALRDFYKDFDDSSSGTSESS
ncbi:hypothetical protein MHBO_000507 [Bonamia ostreae]|uniref:CBS domain-containing protein n=1 Tax=Bonamia ostreae TaxID=126728 RepID=A0ABV2AFW1_9EUKA